MNFLAHQFSNEKTHANKPQMNPILPVLALPVPTTLKEHDRFVGIFYSKWEGVFANIAAPFALYTDKKLPLDIEANKLQIDYRTVVSKASF